MATAAKRVSKWNPAHHPRDARGRFTKSATRVLKPADAKLARAAAASFKPLDLGAGAESGKQWLEKAAGGPARPKDDAVDRYFAGGWKTTNAALRTKKDAAQGDDVVGVDKAMKPLPDDVMLERNVPMQMFAHVPMDQLVGMKVRDAAYASTNLQGANGDAPDGMVTMHFAAPAGTRAIVNPADNEILLDRDTEIAVSRVEPNGRGGYNLYGIVIPKQGTQKPGRAVGEPDQGGAPDDGNGPDSAAPGVPNTPAGPDGGGGGDQGASDTTTAAPRKRAAPTKPAADKPADQGSDKPDGSKPDGGNGSTAGTPAPSQRPTPAQRPAGKDNTPDDADTAAAAYAADRVALAAADHEQATGRPAPSTVADLERNDHVQVAGTDAEGKRQVTTGYASTPQDIGGQTMLVMSEQPDGQGTRTTLRVDGDAPVTPASPPNPDNVEPTTAPALFGQMPAGIIPHEQRPQYRADYLRGWRAAVKNSPSNGLEDADKRGEATGWYDAWADNVADLPQFYTARRLDAEEGDRINGDVPYLLMPVKLDPDTGEYVRSGPAEDAQGLNGLNFLLAGATPDRKIADPVPAGTANAHGRVDNAGQTYAWGPNDGRGGITPDPADAPAAGTDAPGGHGSTQERAATVGADMGELLAAGLDRGSLASSLQDVLDAHQLTGDETPELAALVDLVHGPEGRVQGAVEKVLRDDGRPIAGDEWISLRRLRPHLTGMDKAEQDQALLKSSRKPGVNIVPESNQKMLTAADHEASLHMGGQDKHLINIDRSDRDEIAAAARTLADTKPDDKLATPDVADRTDPEISQPTRDKWDGHGRPARVLWFGDGTKPKKRGEVAELTQNGTGKSAHIMVRGEGDSELLRRQNINDRMWLAPVDAPDTTPDRGRDQANAPDVTAGTSAPDATVDGEQGPTAQVGDRIPANVAELLGQPTIGPSRYSPAADKLTWPAALSAPRIAAREQIDGQDIAIVQYAVVTKPDFNSPASLSYSDQFYAVPADTRMRPLALSFLNRDGYYSRPGDGHATGGVTSNTAEPVGKYRAMHIASGKSAAAALSGARRKVEKDLARERYAPVAAANVAVHDQADFDRLNPNADIRPGDLVVLRTFGKLRTGVATKVTANKVDALVSTPTGEYDNWYGTAQKGVGVRLLRRADSPAVPAVDDGDAPSAPIPDAPPVPVQAVTDLTDGDFRAATSGRVFAGTQLDGVTPNDLRFRMRRARVGNRELDLFDEQGTRLGTLHEQPGRDGWLTMPAGGRAGVTVPTFADGVASLRAGEVSPDATPDRSQERREQTVTSLATSQAEAVAEAVDSAIDRADPADPAEARKVALEAKRAELQKARDEAQRIADTPFGGSAKRKSFGVRVDANVRRTAEAFRTVDRLEREVKALERPPAPTVPAGGFTPELLDGAKHIRTRYGWHEVVKVNQKSVKVKAAPGMDDLIPVKRIIDARGEKGEKLNAPSTAGTSTPETPATAVVTAAADTTVPAPGEALAPPADEVAPVVVDRAPVNVDDEVRVAGQWATVTANVDGLYRVRFPGDRIALVNPTDVRAHRPATRVDDMFGGTTTFVPQDRSTIGIAGRADVGRTQGQQRVQALTMFDVADQQQIDGQTALLDAFMQMPAAPAPASVPVLEADAPEPARVHVPDDLTAWSDEQLSGLFAEVSAQAEYDEPNTLKIMGEWERREGEMQALLARVPDDLTTLSDDDAMSLFADLTAHHGTMDADAVARLEADLDRRDQETADWQAKRDLVNRDPETLEDWDTLTAAINAANDLDDEPAVNRLIAEMDRRQAEEDAAKAQAERVEQERVAAEQRAAAAEATAKSSADEVRRILEVGEAENAATHDRLEAEDLRWRVEHAGEQVADQADNAARDRFRNDTPALNQDFDPAIVDEFESLTDPEVKSVAYAGWFGTGDVKAKAERAMKEHHRREALALARADHADTARKRRRLLTAPVAELTDDELADFPAVLDALPAGEQLNLVRTVRVPEVLAEADRRAAERDRTAARLAAGPAGPARVANPLTALADVERNAQAGMGNQDTWVEARGRLNMAWKHVLGIEGIPTGNAIEKARKADQRDPAEQAALVLAWYRHLGGFEPSIGRDAAAWRRGPVDDPDVPDVTPPLPVDTIKQSDTILKDMLRRATIDRDGGDWAGAIRYSEAQARMYRIPFDHATVTSDTAARDRLFTEAANARRQDPRTAKQQAAAVVTEWRRLAEEQGVDPFDSLRFGPSRPGAKRVGIGRKSDPVQEAQINALVSQGVSHLDAYAQVHQLDADKLRRQETDGLIRAGAAGAKTLAQAYRQHYDEMVYEAHDRAEQATGGHMLNDEGQKLLLAGKLSTIDLFSGSSARAYKYASEDLKRWWGENPPPRMTFQQWRETVQGDPAGLRAAVQAQKGNEFA